MHRTWLRGFPGSPLLLRTQSARQSARRTGLAHDAAPSSHHRYHHSRQCPSRPPSPSRKLQHRQRAAFVNTSTILDRPLFPASCAPSFSTASSAKSPEVTPGTSDLPPTNPTSSTTNSTRPTASRLLLRILTTTSLFVVVFTAGFAMAAAPALEVAASIAQTPSDAETLTLFEPHSEASAAINDHIVNHPIAQYLRARGNFKESRPYFKIPAAMRVHSLTAGALYGENKLEVPSLNFSETGNPLPSFVQLIYLGPGLCGHPGIIHGGMLATLLDEGLARACFPALPNQVGVTASLKVDYRIPCPGPTYILLRAQTTKVEGRKAWVTGWVEKLPDDAEALMAELEGTAPAVTASPAARAKYVEAEALFIEPKHAQTMKRLYGTGTA